MPLKQRILDREAKPGNASSTVTGGSTTNFDLSINASGWEYLSDGDHQWPIPRRNARGDYGGNFTHLRTNFEDSSRRVDTEWTKGVRQFKVHGNYPSGVKTFGLDASCLPVPLSANTMLGYGATGWAQSSPVRPDHNFGTTLIEMSRDGIPVLNSIHRMWKQAEVFRDAASQGRLIRLFSTSSEARERAAKLVAGGYLTYEFDYAPFMRDVNDLLDIVTNGSDKYEQLVRQGSKGTRRKRVVLKDRTSVVEAVNSTYGPAVVLPTQAYTSQGRYTRTRTTSRKIWFSGKFLWPAVRRDAPLGKARDAVLRYQTDFGLDVTPYTLWKAMPWSWLIDWTTNMSDCVGNYSDILSTGLICRHAYVMAQVTQVIEHSFMGCRLSDQDQTSLDGHQKITTLSQQRLHALPFGFTLDNPLTSYSTKQWAILAALGVSKGAYKL